MSRPRNVPDYPDEIMSLAMFHPTICCREQAESYVLQHSKGVGSFIIRPNTENDPSFVSITISIPGKSTCNARILIEKTSKGFQYFISDKIKFSTFNELLNFYREHRIQNKQGIDQLRLTLPLRKGNLQHRGSVGSIGLDRRVSTTNSGFDEDQKGVVKKVSGVAQLRKLMGRTKSESQINPPPGVFQHGGSLKDRARGRSSNSVSSTVPEHDYSGQNPFSPNGNTVVHYANFGSIKQDPKSIVKCRPPAPLPRPMSQPHDDSFYYTIIQAKKDFFLETYKYLKEIELCECGLSVVNSELALGWTIHISHDPDTLNHIFFQQGETTTTWNMPSELVYELTGNQVKFIVCLCRDGKQPIPLCLRERLDKEIERRVSNASKSTF